MTSLLLCWPLVICNSCVIFRFVGLVFVDIMLLGGGGFFCCFFSVNFLFLVICMFAVFVCGGFHYFFKSRFLDLSVIVLSLFSSWFCFYLYSLSWFSLFRYIHPFFSIICGISFYWGGVALITTLFRTSINILSFYSMLLFSDICFVFIFIVVLLLSLLVSMIHAI